MGAMASLMGALRVVLALSLMTPAGGAAHAADDPLAGVPSREEQQTMAKILDLEEQIRTLLETLPPPLRDTLLRQRLAAITASSAPDAEPAPHDAGTEAGETAIEPASSVTEALVAEPEPAVPTRERSKPPPTSCNTLALFDSNQDGSISALDRYWRHLYLWSDRDGDGVMQESEVASAYDRGIRSIAVNLDTFERKRDDKLVTGEIEVDRYIILDVDSDGFEMTSQRAGDGVLVIDSDRIGRGDGPKIMDETGLPLGGLQAFRAGLQLAVSPAVVESLTCP